jgi:hypothetical protein
MVNWEFSSMGANSKRTFSDVSEQHRLDRQKRPRSMECLRHRRRQRSEGCAGNAPCHASVEAPLLAHRAGTLVPEHVSRTRTADITSVGVSDGHISKKRSIDPRASIPKDGNKTQGGSGHGANAWLAAAYGPAE